MYAITNKENGHQLVHVANDEEGKHIVTDLGTPSKKRHKYPDDCAAVSDLIIQASEGVATSYVLALSDPLVEGGYHVQDAPVSRDAIVHLSKFSMLICLSIFNNLESAQRLCAFTLANSFLCHFWF